MSDARSRVHRNAQAALPGSSTAAAWNGTMRSGRPEGKTCKPLIRGYHASRRGCSSGVEHNLAKVGVGGSNPLARAKLPVDLNALLADGPEQGLVHWRETGAKFPEQQIDGADGVLQVRRI